MLVHACMSVCLCWWGGVNTHTLMYTQDMRQKGVCVPGQGGVSEEARLATLPDI